MHFGVDTGNGMGEAAAVSYTQGYHGFDYTLPAIKKAGKSDNRAKMFPIPFGKASNLIAKVKEQSKEAIQMKTRDPGKTPDWTFGGQFPVASPANFLLFHSSNPTKDLCTLSMIELGKFWLVVGYPLSPLQGFLAGVASALPV
jgi:hypothetical protein